MPNWSHVLAMSLGVAKLTDTLVQAADRVGYTGVHPWLKSATSTALSIGAGIYLGGSARERLLLSSAISGGAALVHGRAAGGAETVLVRGASRSPVPRL